MASIASIIAAVLRAMYTWSKQTFDQVERQNTLTSPPHETVELCQFERLPTGKAIEYCIPLASIEPAEATSGSISIRYVPSDEEQYECL